MGDRDGAGMPGVLGNATAGCPPTEHLLQAYGRSMNEPRTELRILIVADIRLYRDGLAHLLDREDGLSVVGTASDPEHAIAQSQLGNVDIVLLDMAIPGSLTTTRLIVEGGPARVIGLGVTEIEQDVIACAEAGVSAYVPRDAVVSDLVQAIRSAERGELRCSPRMAATLFRHAAKSTLAPGKEADARSLTNRELGIVHLLDSGLSNKEIAQRIGIEVGTVKNHVHHILAKLHVRTRGEAAARMRGGLQRHKSLHA